MFKFSPAIREHVDIGEENTRVSAQEWSKGDRENGSYGLKYLDAYSIRNTLRNDALPRKEKDPGSFTLPCYIINVCFEKSLADLGASNKSFDPLYGDYIELNDLNEPLELKRNRVDDLGPTVEEDEVVNEPVMDIVKTRCDFISGLDDYPIVEYMDPYLDEGIRDVAIGEPFSTAS
ncbi:hypothetical protein Tco_0010603 [Tanacetum coccineum]